MSYEGDIYRQGYADAMAGKLMGYPSPDVAYHYTIGYGVGRRMLATGVGDGHATEPEKGAALERGETEGEP